MMHGSEKSDSAIVAVKPANKAGQPAAEWAEPRAGTKGNAGYPRTWRTQSRESVSQGLDRARIAARQRKKERFRHYVTDLWRRTLRRRSQKDHMTWSRMTKLADTWLPPPRILHPWPDQRFAVTHPR